MLFSQNRKYHSTHGLVIKIPLFVSLILVPISGEVFNLNDFELLNPKLKLELQLIRISIRNF